MQKSRPFARALNMLSLIAAIGLPATIAKAGEYRSRGKGLGRHSGKKWGSPPSYRDMVRVKTETRGKVWLQKENGARERIRRQRQMGTLSQVVAS